LKRREFIAGAAATPLAFIVSSCGLESVSSNNSEVNTRRADGYKSFAYYQGLGPTELRSSSRTDGTYYNMPCISALDVEAAEPKDYPYWHGHSRQHNFTISSEDFAELAAGRTIELYTDVVDGHRHALKIIPSEICEA
jgi:hypothetical protein